MDHSFENLDLTIPALGKATIPSPLKTLQRFSEDGDRVLLKVRLSESEFVNNSYTLGNPLNNSFEKTGPRKSIFFNPKNTKAAIVTCGGLCPGLNAIIRTLVRQIWNRYEVKNIVGVRFGYGGLGNNGEKFINLNPTVVEDIHMRGGTILGSSRGTPTANEIVDNLVRHNINILFTIGGDGTMRGARAICEEIKKRKLSISVIGVPKTIDNDIPFVETSFGFATAVEKASEAVLAAHEEARGHSNGIGLVKLMGRNAGFIAANTALSTGCVSICLVPEVPFIIEKTKQKDEKTKPLPSPSVANEAKSYKLDVIGCVEECFKNLGHAVIVVAEGAGQELTEAPKNIAKDPSGNKYFTDIGGFLKEKISMYLEKKGINHSLKYIDPSYIVRSAPANTHDRVFCARIAQNAVHAAMAGKTAMLIGFWHGEMTHVPFKALEQHTKKINPDGAFWFTVTESTTQSLYARKWSSIQ